MTFGARTFQGMQGRNTITYTYSVDTANSTLSLSAGVAPTGGTVSGTYVAGNTDIFIVVASGKYVYSTSTASAAMTLTGGTVGDTLKITNDGYIIGRGGNGGGTYAVNSTTIGALAPTAGGVALDSAKKIDQILGAGYIAGGGGGGGYRHGGGGAGSGTGSPYVSGASGSYTSTAGAAGGGLGGAGANGTNTVGGGGGGRTLPGATSPIYVSNGLAAPNQGYIGQGGEAGGGGGGSYYTGSQGGGGGGGWGKVGGTGHARSETTTLPGRGGGADNVGASSTATSGTISASEVGAAGGAAIQTNSQGIGTISNTVYGQIL